MAHRGPDAEDVYANGPALLAHTRLSILDLSEAGRQPMANADGTVHIVFNGEIYNYRELRSEVNQYSFKSETDTEVLLHLYEEYGVDCLEYLRGMFAFAIWDENEERLFMARDRFGQKPLFYADRFSGITFGSTINTVLCDSELVAEPDMRALRSYLTYQYVPSPRTGFQNIRQLPPAHYMIVSEDSCEQEQYWSLSYADQFDAPPEKLADRLRTRLREATRLRMRSDVPLGVFLSGGVDSAAVAALMADISDEPIQTYSIGFDVEKFDELPFARQVAERYDTDHTEYTLTAESMLDSVDDLLNHYQMPFGDTSALPTYHVSRLASQNITVALTGDAGDENFAGYNRYSYSRTLSYLRNLPSPIRDAGAAALRSLPEPYASKQLPYYARRALKISKLDPPDDYAEFVCHATRERADQVWEGEQPEDEIREIRQAFEASDGPTRLDKLLDVDFQTYLPGSILQKVDRASMAHSLEVRSPFLDHEFAQFAARIPAEYKLRGRTQKWILKRAVRDILPDDIIDRPKQGFGVPVHDWLRGDLRELTREKLDRLGSREPYNSAGVNSLFQEHQEGYDDHGYYLWDLLMLEKWYERYID